MLIKHKKIFKLKLVSVQFVIKSNEKIMISVICSNTIICIIPIYATTVHFALYKVHIMVGK